MNATATGYNKAATTMPKAQSPHEQKVKVVRICVELPNLQVYNRIVDYLCSQNHILRRVGWHSLHFAETRGRVEPDLNSAADSEPGYWSEADVDAGSQSYLAPVSHSLAARGPPCSLHTSGVCRRGRGRKLSQ